MKKRTLRTSMIWMLLVFMLLPSILTVAASAASDVPDALDYSNPTSPVVVEKSAAELIALITGTSVSAAEKEYVNSQLGTVFWYNDAIPQSVIDAEYEDDKMHITAAAYAYTAANGETVVWIPEYAQVNGKYAMLTYSIGDGAYVGTIDGVDSSVESTVLVYFNSDIKVAADVVDDYRNYAYDYAIGLWEQKEAYEKQLAAYLAYQEYLQAVADYHANYQAWEEYQILKEKYDIKYSEYLAYLEEYEAYSTQLAAYLAYREAEASYDSNLAAYNQYLKDQAAYDIAYKEYELYLSQVERIQQMLTVMDSVFVTSSTGHQMYATLMGDTVATVVNRKDELVNIGKCDPNDIENAGASTERLKSVLGGYLACTTDAEKFAYYKANYTAIRDNFITLYGSLYALYQNSAVKSALSNYGKLDRYIEFVSQLYVISTGLDDTQSRSGSWSIKGLYDMDKMQYITYTYSDVLESVQMPEDKNNADPSGMADLPATTEKPTVPTVVEQPVLPEAVEEPLAPDVVLEPTAPMVVEKPKIPTPVEDPGETPTVPIFTSRQQALIDAIDSRKLIHRKTGSDATITLTSSVGKRVSAEVKNIVTFYDYDGKTVITEYRLDPGDAVGYNGSIPYREPTEKYTYEFVGWKTADGKDAVFGSVTESFTAYYASYAATLRSYTVRWVVEGKVTEQVYDYGVIPSYGETPLKPADEEYSYEFIGWSQDVVEVTGDVTYEAMFRSIPRTYTVRWLVDGKETLEQYSRGEMPSYQYSTAKDEDAQYVYTFLGWDKTIATVIADVTYTATYSRSPIATDSEGNNIIVTNTGGAYRAEVSDSTIRVDTLMALADRKDRTVELSFGDGNCVLLFNAAAVADMCSIGCTEVEVSSLGEVGAWSVRFLKEDGSAAVLTYNVTLKANLGGAATVDTHAYTVNEEGILSSMASAYESGYITVKLTAGTDVVFKNEFRIILSECENGVINVQNRYAHAGETVTLTFAHAEGYEVAWVRVLGDSGTEYAVDADGVFTMPAEAVTVTASIALREYTVIFVVDGVEVSRSTYYKGDTVTVPADPAKAQQDNTIFTFQGWSPSVTTVTEDVTYTAVFKTSVEADKDAYVPDSQNRFYILVLQVLLILVVLIAGIVFLIVFLRRRRKKAKAAGQAETAAVSKNGFLRFCKKFAAWIMRGVMNLIGHLKGEKHGHHHHHGRYHHSHHAHHSEDFDEEELFEDVDEDDENLDCLFDDEDINFDDIDFDDDSDSDDD